MWGKAGQASGASRASCRRDCHDKVLLSTLNVLQAEAGEFPKPPETERSIGPGSRGRGTAPEKVFPICPLICGEKAQIPFPLSQEMGEVSIWNSHASQISPEWSLDEERGETLGKEGQESGTCVCPKGGRVRGLTDTPLHLK